MWPEQESTLTAVADPEPLLAVRELSKEFGAVRALERASFTVRRGEVLGLIGPNGSGKTTLFECIAGLVSVDEGSVEIDGRGIAASLRHRTMFYVPDGIVPWESQPVGWVLRFFEGLHSPATGARDALIHDLSLSDLLHRPIGTLSRGQRKRLLVALGLLTPCPLLLLDEPFEGLDIRQVREMATILRKHAGAGRTLFLSIHQLTDAALVCDRMVLLSGGRVAGLGTLDELRTSARLPDGTLEDLFLALT